MAKMRKAIFVEPLDPETNRVIATELLPAEEYLHEGTMDVESVEHNVYEFGLVHRDKLIHLLFHEELRFTLWVKNRSGRLECLSLTRQLQLETEKRQRVNV